MMNLIITFIVLMVTTIAGVAGGPLAYGICQTGCATVVVACYSAAGAVFGAVAAVAATPAVAACNTAYGTCQAACVAAGFAPTL